MASDSLIGRLKQFDAYPKTLEDFRIKTYGGATITLISSTIIFLLFLSELFYYLSTDVRQELYVDTSRGEKLRINVDIIFHRSPCLYLSVDVMDVSGEHQLDLLTSVLKQRLSVDGKQISEEPQQTTNEEKDAQTTEKSTNTTCLSCYGAENEEQPCCNTCEEVREAYRRKGWALTDPSGISQCVNEGWTAKLKEQINEGCRVYGHLEVSKVAGNIHFAPGKSFQQHSVHVHDLQSFGTKRFNMSHTIKRLSFGAEYPGLINPLDNHSETDTNEVTNSGGVMYQYFIKVVPTVYHMLTGETLGTNQFSATKHQRSVRAVAGETGLPGVFFIYDLSPMLVQLTEYKHSFAHFVTNVCAIVGGVFTVAGMLDGMLYHSTRALQKKIEIGKLS